MGGPHVDSTHLQARDGKRVGTYLPAPDRTRPRRAGLWTPGGCPQAPTDPLPPARRTGHGEDVSTPDRNVPPARRGVLPRCLAAAIACAALLAGPGPVVGAEPDGAGAGAGHHWPLRPTPEVTRHFDRLEHRYAPGHRGADLAGGPGATVYAAGTGTVAFAGQVAGRPVVSIDHPSGLRTTYEPVRASVAAGDRVVGGGPIGALQAGHPGCPRPACLHFGLRDGKDYLDPLALLRSGPVRLKPLGDGAAALTPAGGPGRVRRAAVRR